MNFFLQRSEVRDLYEKVASGARISDDDAQRLFESKDLNAVGAIADLVRQRKNGNRGSYILNRYINYSNYCILSCQFCAFARKKRDKDGFQYSVEEIVDKARETVHLGITELHIVGGLHPSLPFSYYTDMLRQLNALNQRSAAVPAVSSGGVSPPVGAGKRYRSTTGPEGVFDLPRVQISMRSTNSSPATASRSSSNSSSVRPQRRKYSHHVALSSRRCQSSK